MVVHKKGFTLVEVIVVLVILAILAAILVPSMVGWIDKAIYFDGQNWTLMDPTFTSTGNRSQSIMQYVTDKTNYTQKYAY